MDQMAGEMTVRADVKDKRRVNTAEESSTWARGDVLKTATKILTLTNAAVSDFHLYLSSNNLENTQSEAQVSDWRLGSSAETEPGESSRDADAQRPRECDSSSPLFSLKRYLRRSSSATSSSSSTDSLSSSQTSNVGVDCAGIVLNCLFCRFYDMILLLSGCERVANLCCPNYKQVVTTAESPSSSDDCCTNIDCGVCNPGQDAGDCLELAMEISEICYH